MNATQNLVEIIRKGSPNEGDRKILADATEDAIDALFGERYYKKTPYSKRAALMPGDENVPFAGILSANSPSSGVYGGMSLIWFPIKGDENDPSCSLLTLVCGTKGLDPDASILSRPGHVRFLHALRRHLREKLGFNLWVKHDPTDLNQPFPGVVRESYEKFSHILDRYGRYIYAAIEVPQGPEDAYKVVTSLLDFYAKERNWAVLKVAESEIQELQKQLRSHLWPKVTIETVSELLKERRYIIIQGPPGTGKTRLALQLLEQEYKNVGKVVQFHPAITYENFVVGIGPSIDGHALNFEVKAGWLVEANQSAKDHAWACPDSVDS